MPFLFLMTEDCNKDILVVKAPKKSPLLLRTTVVLFAVFCALYMFSICIKQTRFATDSKLFKIQLIQDRPCDKSGYEESELAYLHFPKPETFTRKECACNPVRLFAILSMQRSGSGWFETLLNSHINISSNGEIFGAKDRRSNASRVVEVLDQVYNLDWFSSASKNECSAAVGFKWMLNQGAMSNHKEVVEYFNRRGVSAIFLFRRNLLRRMISMRANAYDKSVKLLNGTHKSHVHSPKEAQILAQYKPKINTTDLVDSLMQVEGTARHALEMFKSTRHIVLYYEDIVSNHTTNVVASDPVTQQQPPQWMPMQYPAMVMQHHMIPPQHYPPHYLPYHPLQQQHHQPPSHQQGSGGGSENKTIWVGDLHNWMDEDYLRNCFASTGEVASIKVIRNKQTGFSEGYGFVEFLSHAAAEKVLQSYTCIPMPNTDQPFRLNWATFSMGDKRSNNGSDLSIFVGDLASDVTDTLLHETFASKYPSVKAAKVVIDANTGRSKGYGFVRFGDDNERSQAMTEMNGAYCSSRAMRIGAATPRKSVGYQQQFSSHGGYVPNGESDGDSTNTTIFVGGLDPSVSDEDLRQPFSQYGEIASVKIPVGKGCGFVQFANRNDADEALQKLNGTAIGKQTVRLSWGRNPANKQFRGEYGNQWTGAYYGGQIYDGYGYAMPAHDPSMYAAAAYGAYPMYGTHQQQVS